MSEVSRAASYAAIREQFRWRIPQRYSIAEDICGRWAASEPDRVALVERDAEGGRRTWTYGALQEASGRIANVLAHGAGLGRGDRCAILLPQSAATVQLHIALYRMGAVALPLFALFGEDAIAYRLTDSGARVVVTDATQLAKIQLVCAGLDEPPEVFVCGTDAVPDARALDTEMANASDRFENATLAADDPAFLSYTSGTTGPAKGVLHAQRVLLGHLPGVQLPHEWLPQPGDRMWTPADWAWMGGLTNVMMPALRFGVSLVAWRASKFDPEEALHMMRAEGVRNAFVPPTALRMIRQAVGGKTPMPALRSLASGGEALGDATLEWGRSAFGLTINEFYGQTECNLVVGNCASLFDPRPNSAGRALPGHTVAVIGPEGEPRPPGETGELAVRAPDPVMFLRYWRRAEATRAKFAGPWMRTGDLGTIDEDGFVRFVARTDDVITSSGYRIGPGEIEDCLAGHPAVALAAVVGLPDALRTEVVSAFVVCADSAASGEELAQELRHYVGEHLGRHLAPRDVRFVDSLPRTATGKIMRRMLREGRSEA